MERKTTWISLVIIAALTGTAWADWEGWVHLHTKFSDGAMTPEELVSKAHEERIDFVVPLDHWPGIGNPIKEINGIKRRVSSKYVGMENYLKTWKKLNHDFWGVIIPGVEYTFSRSHLGVVNISLELHNRIVEVFDDKRLTDEQKIKRILGIVRNSDALPLICHPTLKMAHPQKGKKEFAVTDYSFDSRLWKDEPIVLVEFMNHGNLDTPEDLVALVLNEGSPEDPSIVAVAGVDFHTKLVEKVGFHWNWILDRPSAFPDPFKRITRIVAFGYPSSTESVIEKLREGGTYLTYDSSATVRCEIGRRYLPYYDSASLVGSICFYYYRREENVTIQAMLYRDDRTNPLLRFDPAKSLLLFEEDQEEWKNPHRYFLLVPGYLFVGPIYRRQE